MTATDFTVATWNVLHRVHGENWGEAVVGRWPDEAERIAAITAHLAALDADVIALQEVSGDQLASLRSLPHTVLAFRYPRVPKAKAEPGSLRDRTEHLVVLVRGAATTVAAEAFATDPGKGLLAVRTAHATVIDTHVTFGAASAAQLRRLGELGAAAAGPAIVLGDYNASVVVVAAGLGAAFVAIEPEPGVPTRPRPDGATKSSHIDHVFARGVARVHAAVLDVGGLSDHNLVRARVRS